MTCRDVTAFLMAYLAGELPPSVQETFARHLARCANCREFLHQYQATLQASRAVCDEEDRHPIPEDLVQAIVASIAAEKH
jgi:predicted anti-sigma-YlaC factor YlaD